MSTCAGANDASISNYSLPASVTVTSEKDKDDTAVARPARKRTQKPTTKILPRPRLRLHRRTRRRNPILPVIASTTVPSVPLHPTVLPAASRARVRTPVRVTALRAIATALQACQALAPAATANPPQAVALRAAAVPAVSLRTCTAGQRSTRPCTTMLSTKSVLCTRLSLVRVQGVRCPVRQRC